MEKVKACRLLAEKNMVVANSGNISVRNDNPNTMTISGTGTWFENITDIDFVEVNMDNCDVVNRELSIIRPSKEAIVHASIYKKREDVNCIIHFQSPYATTLCALEDFHMISLGNIPEMIYYIKKYAMVPYAEPGSTELANLVSEMFAEDLNTSVVGIRCHGLFSSGPNIEEAVKNAFFFELDCQVSMRKYLLERKVVVDNLM